MLNPAQKMDTLLSALNACIIFKSLKLALKLLHQKKIKVFLNNYFNDWVANPLIDLTFFLLGGNFRKRSTTQRYWKIKQSLISTHPKPGDKGGWLWIRSHPQQCRCWKPHRQPVPQGGGGGQYWATRLKTQSNQENLCSLT